MTKWVYTKTAHHQNGPNEGRKRPTETKTAPMEEKTRPKRPQLTSKTAHYVTLYKYPPPFLARYVLDDLDAASSSLGQAICRLVEHGNDLETCWPGPRGQTTSGVWSAQYLTAVAGQYADGLRNSLHIRPDGEKTYLTMNPSQNVLKMSDTSRETATPLTNYH